MATLAELVELKILSERNKKLKGLFNCLSEDVDITGFEEIAVTVLFNITEPLSKVKNVLDTDSAKQNAHDEKWWKEVIETLQHLQSHNLKYPDYRCTGDINAPQPKKIKNVITSANVKIYQTFYAKNSNQVGKAMFWSNFIWQGKRTNLKELLQNEESVFMSILNNVFDIDKPKRDEIVEKLKIVSTQTMPEAVSSYSPQIIMPYLNDDIMITPVSSQALLHEIQLETFSSRHPYTKYNHARSSNVGSLAAASGGHCLMIESYPNTKFKKQKIEINSWLTQNLVEVFNEEVNSPQYLETHHQIKDRHIENQLVMEEGIRQWILNKSDGFEINEYLQLFHADLSKINMVKGLAYEPDMLKLTKKLLKKVLQTSEIKSHSEKRYIILPELLVSSANAMSCDYLVGTPAISAFWGFCRNYIIRLSKLLNEELTYLSFAMKFHDFSVIKRGQAMEPLYRSRNEIKVPGLLDSFSADFCFSLVIELEHGLEVDNELLLAAMPGRLANGSISLTNKAHLVDIASAQGLSNFQFKQGKWLSGFEFDKDIETYSDLLAINKKSISNVIINQGLQLLDQPKIKTGVDEGYKHAFAEPILGLAEMIEVSQFSNLANEPIWWELNCESNHFIFQSNER